MTVVDSFRFARRASCNECSWLATGKMLEAVAQKHANQNRHQVAVDYDMTEVRDPHQEEGTGDG